MDKYDISFEVENPELATVCRACCISFEKSHGFWTHLFEYHIGGPGYGEMLREEEKFKKNNTRWKQLFRLITGKNAIQY